MQRGNLKYFHHLLNSFVFECSFLENYHEYPQVDPGGVIRPVKKLRLIYHTSPTKNPTQINESGNKPNNQKDKEEKSKDSQL